MSAKSGIELYAEIAKSLVEIGAIFVGGYWTYDKFIRLEAPQLKPNFIITHSLNWSKTSTNDKFCFAELNLNVTNKSKAIIGVKKVTRSAYYISKPELKNEITYFDPILTELGQPADYKEYSRSGDPLIQDYHPDQSIEQSFNWFIKIKPETYTLFIVELYENENDKYPIDTKYSWGNTCDI